ncbi:MAG: peptide chain release factor 3 [Bdellovibrionales bacterium]|nr:peptide chain release factor 3 [Bdellovibrionales bacterium]
MSKYSHEIQRRRTFAIISHPDAGKTTITEQLLLLGGVIQEAGEVKGKKGAKAAKSDWMKMEQERGVSISSSVMQFDYNGLRINWLDTPGHKDFGEDTYRTLHATDCAAMLIDAAKGVESQTRKLYEVCRLRKMPIFTFANKMDREGKSPLDLIDDVENTLHMACYPVTWPIGMGDRFKGLYHRLKKKFYAFEKGTRGMAKVLDVAGPDDAILRDFVEADLHAQFLEELELLEGILPPLDTADFLSGKMTFMTFGSAKHNWGVDLFLDLFTQYAPPPQGRKLDTGEITPEDPAFSGFIFKIQANMDKRHRDRIAYIRVCSGRFERGMKVKHMRLGRELRLNYANQLMGQERNTVEEAFAGDIVGINDTGNFKIGDTVTAGVDVVFRDIPRFSPEHFARISVGDALKRKQLEKGLQQLVDEGTIQKFYDPAVGWQLPILGVVGILQFEVLLYRLEDEYGVKGKMEMLPYKVARWLTDLEGRPHREKLKGVATVLHDADDLPVLLCDAEWALQSLEKQNPEVIFHFTSQG